jgi:hypothetical protein
VSEDRGNAPDAVASRALGPPDRSSNLLLVVPKAEGVTGLKRRYGATS